MGLDSEQLRDYIRDCPAAPEPAGLERPHLTQYGGDMPTMTPAEYQARAGNPLVARFLDLWDGPPLAPEYRFDPQRKWRFDLAHPASMVAVELHGGTWSGGRHTRGRGFARDREKMNSAAFAGWAVIELTTDQITPANVARVQQLVRERMQ